MQWRGLQETRAMLGIYIRLKIALNCFRICYIELLLVGKVFEKAVYKVLEHVSRQTRGTNKLSRHYGEEKAIMLQLNRFVGGDSRVCGRMFILIRQ